MCVHTENQIHTTAAMKSWIGMKISRFVCSAFWLKNIVTYIEGKSFTNISNTGSSSLLLDYYISYSNPLLIKDISYENTTPTHSCILKNNMDIASYYSTQSSAAESLTLTLATEKDAKHPLQMYWPCQVNDLLHIFTPYYSNLDILK